MYLFLMAITLLPKIYGISGMKDVNVTSTLTSPQPSHRPHPLISLKTCLFISYGTNDLFVVALIKLLIFKKNNRNITSYLFHWILPLELTFIKIRRERIARNICTNYTFFFMKAISKT